MAATRQVIARIQIEPLPISTNINNELYNELLLIAKNINLLADRVEDALGVITQAPYSFGTTNFNPEVLVPSALEIASFNNCHRFYIRTAEAFTYGEVASIGSDGLAYRANINNTERRGLAVIGDQSVAAGQIAEAYLAGIFTLPYATAMSSPAARIQAGTSGFIGRITTQNIGALQPDCGIVIAENTVLFLGTISTAYPP